MSSIAVSIPVADSIVAGDRAEVRINGAVLGRFALRPGETPLAGHLFGAHLVDPFLGRPPAPGWLQAGHLSGNHLQTLPIVTLDTPPLAFGLYDVEVALIDALGNESPDPATTLQAFLNIGPLDFPSDPRFGSQVGSGPITFAFTPSQEVLNG